MAYADTTSLYGFDFRDQDKRRERDNEDGTRKFDIKQLWQRSREIINLALLGHKQVEIAEMLDIHPQTVSNTLNSSLGMQATSDKRKERDGEFEKLQDKVMELTKKSLDVYERILSADQKAESENFDPDVSLKMQKDTADTVALELAGMKAPTRIDTRSVHMSLKAEEIDEFKRRGIEAAVAAGKVVEVEDGS